MLKDISELRKKPLDFIRNFLENCTIEEKIDAYYVSVEILSKNTIVLKKYNGTAINRDDMILNEMWSWFFNDWQHLKLVNPEWFNKYIGCKIYMFYLPSSKPILVQYKEGVCYIIDRIEYSDRSFSDDVYRDIEDLKMKDEFMIYTSGKQEKEYDTEDIIKRFCAATKKNENHTETIGEIMTSIIKDPILFAEDKPEGYIFKWKKYIFQYILNKENRVAKAEKSQYEFFLINFCKFWKEYDLTDKLDRSYVKTICNLFNSYITEYEKKQHYLENNIDSSALESPCIGYRFGICYNNIPDEVTIKLCKENELYRNVFKIMLVNLKRKKEAKHCLLMTPKNTEEWNEIVQTISNSCI